jgi:hypothetical protein
VAYPRGKKCWMPVSSVRTAVVGSMLLARGKRVRVAEICWSLEEEVEDEDWWW